MESQSSNYSVNRVETWIALALCIALLAGWAATHFIPNRPGYADGFAPNWVPLAAAVLAAAGVLPQNGRPRWSRVQRALHWGGLLLMVWAANGLPLDLLRLTPLVPPGIDWPGMATRAWALAAAIVLAHLALARPTDPASGRRPAVWYACVAFVVALPYPFFRTVWALGGTIGLNWPGAAGQGFTAWLACIPWLLAATLSVLLISGKPWVPRRLLLTAGWSATAVVAMIGPAACWSLVSKAVSSDFGLTGIATWVPCLFYGSWFFWSIAAAAATRSYQLRSARRHSCHRRQ